jgi:hypothetical protein
MESELEACGFALEHEWRSMDLWIDLPLRCMDLLRSSTDLTNLLDLNPAHLKLVGYKPMVLGNPWYFLMVFHIMKPI